ncbi:hypothetical protein CXF68_11890 [Tenacibaculum sp. Bg11-29]|uniref:hypothetical protein n=1 Tax=Tenacibaculum sp. Bg11-29 TaxID=2058306 RepID=UPI000C34BA7E|nr:hypothetical protein [Tenacibaculum sp. Bg11-29]PKH51340.1 hypothetical protein CXF68_11890 [Tenacibaculum sp. Bg11-29]
MIKTISVRSIKLSLIVFSSLITISCSYKEKKTIVNPKSTFEETQDSLRKVLLNTKPNKNIKSSILQELYIRGLVNKVNNKIKFKLPFNLHGFDCGTPDCYSTDITFEFIAKEPIEFPKNINFKLREHGCDIEPEILESGIFELLERSPNFVNYYSRKKRKLYYFTSIELKTIRGNTITKILNEYNEENTNGVTLYQSSIMTGNEYELFINKK